MTETIYGTQDELSRLAKGTTDMSLSSVWICLDDYFSGEFHKFTYRKEVFLWVLERLLREGRIKLHKDGVFLETSIESQVEAFRKAWPESEAASGYTDFYWWFFDEDDCPAGVAWRQQDGSYRIAD